MIENSFEDFEYIPYTPENADAFYHQLEQWNDADEFTRCIKVLETIPEQQRDYRASFALVRALENYAIIGDHDERTDEEEGNIALYRAIDLLESVREEGKDKAEWNMRMAYAYQYLPQQEEQAIPYAQRWAELDPGDENAKAVIVECQEEIEKRNDQKSKFVTLNINARLQPMHRHDLEDELDDRLAAQKLGFVDGGGTMMMASGEVKDCDIEITLADGKDETIEELMSIIEDIGVPKGSKLLWSADADERSERPVGRLEGMALYLNGTELPKEVYESCDINYAIEQLESRMDGVGRFYSWWEGPQNTALYFYGQSYDKMLAAVQDFIAEYPLCQKCIVEQIAGEQKPSPNKKKKSTPFEGFDFTGFWDDCDYALKEYVCDPPSDELITEIEVELGYKLPASYIWLMKQHNGGIPVNTCFPTNTPTSWAENHVAITGIFGIGKKKTYSLCGELGSQFMIDEWEYPAIGVAICDCPSAGHDMIFLDYRECGSQGEPKVVHIDQECDYAITPLADSFEEFIRGLVNEDEFDEYDD